MFIFKFIGRWIFRVLFLIILILISLYLMRDKIMEYYVNNQFSKITGLTVAFEDVHCSPLKGEIVLNNVTISHPPIMNNIFLAEIPLAKGKINLWNLLFKNLKFSDLQLNISVFQSVEGKDGLSTEFYMKKLAKNMDLKLDPWVYSGIDNFYLSLGTHQIVSLEQPERIWRKRQLNLENQQFENIKTPAELIDILNKILYGK